MIRRNYIIKYAKKYLNKKQINLPENFLPLPKSRQKKKRFDFAQL